MNIKFLRGTLAQYLACSKNADTLYFITDTGALYLGEKLIGKDYDASYNLSTVLKVGEINTLNEEDAQAFASIFTAGKGLQGFQNIGVIIYGEESVGHQTFSSVINNPQIVDGQLGGFTLVYQGVFSALYITADLATQTLTAELKTGNADWIESLLPVYNGENEGGTEGGSTGGGNYVLELTGESGTLTDEQYQAVVDNFPNVTLLYNGALVTSTMVKVGDEYGFYVTVSLPIGLTTTIIGISTNKTWTMQQSVVPPSNIKLLGELTKSSLSSNNEFFHLDFPENEILPFGEYLLTFSLGGMQGYSMHIYSDGAGQCISDRNLYLDQEVGKFTIGYISCPTNYTNITNNYGINFFVMSSDGTIITQQYYEYFINFKLYKIE